MTRPPLIAGVDSSTKLVAIALLNAATGELHSTLKLRCQRGRSDHPAMPRDAAYRIAAETLNSCQRVYIEAPMGKYATDVGNRALGALLSRLTIPATLYVPTRWKALSGLSGAATKADIREHALDLFPTLRATPAVSQDICDAAVIARAGYLDETATRLAENA